MQPRHGRPRGVYIRLWPAMIVVMIAAASNPSVSAALSRTLVASGMSQVVFATAPASDSTRLFVLERAGRIRVILNDTLLSVPFLDIVSRVRSNEGEQGLLYWSSLVLRWSAWPLPFSG